MTLSGRLDLDSVEDLAACADQICRVAVRAAVFDVAALTAVDEAGTRTLAATFRCLAAHGVAAWAVGVSGELQAMLDRLDLTVPAPPTRARRMTAVSAVVAPPPSADLVGLGVALQGAAGGLGLG